MLISSHLLDIRETFPVEAIVSVVSSMNRANPEIISQVSTELTLFLNRSLLLSIIAENKELQKETKSDFDLWKKYEKKQNLFFKQSDFKSSETNKLIDIIGHLQAEFEDKGFIEPFQIAFRNQNVADFLANVITQLSLKVSHQVNNEVLIVSEQSIKKITEDLEMICLEDELKKNFGWEEQSFTNGCGKLDLNGSPLLKPISPNFFKSIFVGNNKGHNLYLNDLLIDKSTILSFHPDELISSEYPKDQQVWESYFINESIFIGYMNIELDILGLPLEKLEVHKENLRDDFFNVNFLLLGQSTFDMTLLNLKNKKIFRIKKNVMYGCRAIKVFNKNENIDHSKNNQTKGPWG